MMTSANVSIWKHYDQSTEDNVDCSPLLLMFLFGVRFAYC